MAGTSQLLNLALTDKKQQINLLILSKITLKKIKFGKCLEKELKKMYNENIKNTKKKSGINHPNPRFSRYNSFKGRKI